MIKNKKERYYEIKKNYIGFISILSSGIDMGSVNYSV